MAIHKLKPLQVEKEKRPGRYGDGNGLYLLVSDTGGKSWLLRVMAYGTDRQGRMKWMRRDIGLGPLSLVSLAEAREMARELRKAARDKKDPTQVRDAKEEIAPTFRQAAQQCHEAKASGWSDKNAAAFLSSLALHVYPKIGDKPVSDVDAKDVALVLGPIWQTKIALSKKIRARIGLVLDYAHAMAWRTDGAPRQSLSALLAKQAEGGNFASMPYESLPAFIQKIEGEPETMGRLALLFTIYTAGRNGEVRGARWSQIDFDKKLWNRPADLMGKTGTPHTITLSPEALAILERAKAWRRLDGDGLIFEGKGGKRLSDMTIGKIVKPTGYTVHGFRSTFRTWAAEKMPSVPEAVAEAALAHTIPDKVIRAYNRAKFLEMRFALLEAWGRYAAGRSGEVIRLPLKVREA
ncbi:integrase arm-type DNA-binding domain-containing protein [Erythrobacter gaetbuli]|uniref:Integrase arm-type DNA-binding domain-containing protein n=1 Tax=Qipengyuania gaetbuli TaxID=266952 RepID=A0A844XW65_9SPHN|nr:site-specific integrase [Qipengyuania gaetbuli]MXO50120.1 integrase arm-type DNA-binding domain-containing protein [Qipengyuania gaetbuli]